MVTSLPDLVEYICFIAMVYGAGKSPLLSSLGLIKLESACAQESTMSALANAASVEHTGTNLQHLLQLYFCKLHEG